MKHNIIAFPNAASFDFSAADRRAEARFRAAERRRNLLSAVETADTLLIGAGFAFCLILTVTLL